MPSQNLSTLFSTTGGAAGTNSGGLWGRPLHETQCQMAIYPGGACCLCVPSNATRVVVEMWGQGSGGSGACCCQWGTRGGQAGTYAYKVWSTANSNSPAIRGSCMSFCGCVCACDCQSYDNYGSCGQFSKLYDCTGYWYGCTLGGQCSGYAFCTATCWWGGCTGDCYCWSDACSVFAASSSGGGGICYALPASESQGNCIGPSCVCGGYGICVNNTVSAYPISFTTAGGATAPVATSGDTVINAAAVTCVWPLGSCSCFDLVRCGAYGFTKIQGSRSDAGACDYKLGVGGAAYAGGAQQQRSANPTTFYYCGLNGNFPGGGGRSSGAFGGGCCAGGAGGGGLILISYKI